MKNNLTILPILFLLFTSCFRSNETEKSVDIIDTNTTTILPDTINEMDSLKMVRTEISNVVLHFIDAYNKHNQQAIDSLTHPEIGITIIYRPGAINKFEKHKKISFENPIPHYYPYDKTVHNYKPIFAKAPVFSCEKEVWDKTGLYIDLNTQTTILKSTANYLLEFGENGDLPKDYKKNIENAESGSFRVVLTSKTPLVFNIKKIEDKWYITILDRAYGDCSA